MREMWIVVQFIKKIRIFLQKWVNLLVPGLLLNVEVIIKSFLEKF